MHPQDSLNGKTVIVTRPLAQAQLICASLECYQATIVHFPVISITTAQDIEPAKTAFQNLSVYSSIIFISANAVHYAIKLAQELNLSLRDSCLATVGPATKTALENYGYNISIIPTAGFNSEALLSHPSLQQIEGQEILIVRGQGGREHLRLELEARGAQISYAEVYQRQLPPQRKQIDLSELPGANTAVLIYSAESVQNLWALCRVNEQQWLTNVTLIVGSPRIAEAASSVGLANNHIIAENPSDEAMLNALIAWAAKR